MASDCSVTARRPRAHSLVDQKSALETASDGQGAASKSRRAHGTRAHCSAAEAGSLRTRAGKGEWQRLMPCGSSCRVCCGAGKRSCRGCQVWAHLHRRACGRGLLGCSDLGAHSAAARCSPHLVRSPAPVPL